MHRGAVAKRLCPYTSLCRAAANFRCALRRGRHVNGVAITDASARDSMREPGPAALLEKQYLTALQKALTAIDIDLITKKAHRIVICVDSTTTLRGISRGSRMLFPV